MKVLLKQDIENVGRMGEVVKVAGGYARNFLMPRGYAVSVTRGNIKEIDQQRKVLEVKAAHEREKSQGVADKIKGARIVITERCSASGKLFGSVTNRRIASEIETACGEEIDRHKIHFDEKIREVGTYTAQLKLHPDVVFNIEFEVEGEGFHPDEQGEPTEDTVAKEAGPQESDVPGEGQEAPVDTTTDNVEAIGESDEDSSQG